MNLVMNNNESGESYDAASDYHLRQEAGEIEIYRRLLDFAGSSKSSNGTVSLPDFAKLLFAANGSFDDSSGDNTSSEFVPRTHANNLADSPVVLTILTLVYLSIFIAGVLGNVVTCIVIAKNKSMHTAVNYYLFSLAISDLCLLICALPDEVYMLWYPEYPFNENICKFHRFAAESFTNATVFTITAFTIERYVAICKPFLSHTLSKLSRAYKFILFIWVISMCLAVPQTLFTLHLDETFTICIPKAEHVHFFVVSTFLLFVIPMSIITILYILIGVQLRKSKIPQRGVVNGSSVRLKRKIFKNPTKHQTLVTVNCDSHYNEALINQQTTQQQQQQQQHRPNDINKNYKSNLNEQESIIPEDGRINYSNNRAQMHHGSRHVVNMLVVVVIAFFICWLPFHVQRLLFSYIDPGVLTDNQSFVVNSISGILFYISTCINPFLYNIMSNKFREAFKVTIAKYIYSNRHEKLPSPNGRGLFRTISQRSYSMNSTSLNTCSSVCSMQPFSTQNQQMTFRYFDSKRPLVVSFRRTNKMTQKNIALEHCGSIHDIHRIEFGSGSVSCGSAGYGLNVHAKGGKECGHKAKYCSSAGNNSARNSMIRSNETQSSRNFNYGVDKHRAHFEVQYDDDDDDDMLRSDRATITYPKEKFYGNAKLMGAAATAASANNDEALRKKPSTETDDNGHKLLRNRQNLATNRHNGALVNGSRVSLTECAASGNNNKSNHKTFLSFKFAKLLHSRSDINCEPRVSRKCSSSPSLCKISQFPNSLDIVECNKENGDSGRGSFVSILSAKRKEAFIVKTSKSC